MRTGYEIREGSRMIAERIAKAEARAEQEARQRRLAILRRNMFYAIKGAQQDAA